MANQPVSSNPEVVADFETFSKGWDSAVAMVLEVADQMISKGDFDSESLEELKQRIV